MRQTIRRFLAGAGACTLVLLGSVAQARTLSDIFTQDLAGLDLGPVGPALANTVAQTYPVASASSSVAYAYNPATEAFERQTRVLGPIIGERAETIGKGQIDVALSYSYVSLASINGMNLGHLVNQPSINGQVVSYPVPGGVTLADGRITNFLPVYVDADITVEAQILTPQVTYGITPDLDVNLTLPLLYTYVRAGVQTQVPDPRLPEFALPAGDPNMTQTSEAFSDSAVGVGDLQLRAKYVFLRDRPVDLAAGLALSLPTGNDQNLQGTGTTRLVPGLILSHVFADRFEPLLNLAVDINANDVSRSIFVWAVGGTAQIWGPLTGALVFLGRNEFSAQSDAIAEPFFFQIERNDIYDVSLGLRYLLAESGVISANFIVPLNSDGFRPDFIPTFECEYTFSTPD